MTQALVILAALCALAYLGLTGRAPSLGRSVVKTGSVAALALAAAAGVGPPLLAVALGLCALGDWCLSRPGERAFMAGVAAFAAGHLAYVALFLAQPESEVARLLEPSRLALLAGLAALGAGMLWLLLPRAGALAVPVAIYVPIILAMGLAAATLAPVGPLAWALPVALAFVVSDAILALEKFAIPETPGTHGARRVAGWAAWTLYWGAQAGFFAAFA